MSDEHDDPTNAVPTCRHLLICHHVWKSQDLPNAGFSLGGLLVHAVPDIGFPLWVDRLFLYAQVYGPTGEYQFVVRLVRIDDSGYGEEVETPLGDDGEHVEYVVPRAFEVSGLNFVDEFALPMRRVVFEQPGVYEFQLFCHGSDDPIARERVQARA